MLVTITGLVPVSVITGVDNHYNHILMKNSIITSLLLLVITTTAIAQKAEVERKLQQYNIPSDFFVDNLKDENAKYSFKFKKTTETTNQETKVEMGVFDPAQPEGERWKLLSVNGKQPTKKQIKQFLKEHNSSEDSGAGEPMDDDWKILEDNDSQLIIEFRYREGNLPHKYKFLAQCKGKVFIDKEKKRLDKVDFYNTGDVKIKMFNVNKLDMTMYYKYDEESKIYLLDKETLLFDTHILGQPVEVNSTTEFYDYNKVIN